MDTRLVKPPIHGGTFYQHIGATFDSIDAYPDLINSDVLDAWYPPAPRVLEFLSKHMQWLARTSPPTYSEGLIETLSASRNIPQENILVGGGSSALMYSFLTKIATSNTQVLLLDPMYGEYDYIFRSVIGADVRKHELSQEEAFRIDPARLVTNALTSEVLVIVNPNNPTGQYLSRSELCFILDSLPDSLLVIVDETYSDFVTEEISIERNTVSRPNLLVLKSMSKYYALSGLRVAYMVSNSDMIAKMRSYCPPWSVGTLAQAAGCIALKERDYYDKRRLETIELRLALAQGIGEISGVTVVSHGANFVLAQLNDGRLGVERLCSILKKGRIHIRNCDSQGARFKNDFFRVAVKERDKNIKVREALHQALA